MQDDYLVLLEQWHDYINELNQIQENDDAY